MINVTKTYLPDKNKLDKYIEKIYESGWLTNNGSLVQELESKLSKFLGVDYLVLLSNGTLALQVMYHLFNIKKKVITTPFSFVATTSSLFWERIEPYFSDIDQSTFNLNPEGLKDISLDEAEAILAVHVFGNACDVESLDKISHSKGIKLFFDAAHAFDVKDKTGKNILNYGDASILSFHSTKIFHTIEGGALIVKNKELYDEAKLMINFGISGYDQVSKIGINAKMNEFQAAMGLAILEDYHILYEQRKEVYERYLMAFTTENNIQLQQLNPYFDYNYSYFPILLPDEDTLLNLKSNLLKENINPRRYFYPSLNTLPYVKYKECPNSQNIAKRILCLPFYPQLTWKTQKTIIKIVKESV